MLIPDDYINIISERLNLYTELSKIKTIDALNNFEVHLMDRFGALPKQVSNLLLSVQLKWQAQKLGIEKLILKKQTLLGYFVSDQQSEFYNSTIFSQVLKFAQWHPKICSLKEKQTPKGLRLLIRFDKVHSVEKALELFGNLLTQVIN